MKIRVLILLLFISSCSFSQKAYLDSLWQVWSDNSQADTTRLIAMYNFAWDGYLFVQPDSSYFFSKKMYDFAAKSGQKKYKARALNLQANYFLAKGNYAQAMRVNNEGLELSLQINDKLGEAVSFNVFGVVYEIQGDFAKAIDYYTKSLKCNDEIGKKDGVATSLHNIGHLYQEQLEVKKALEYYNRSLKIRENINDQLGIATSEINICSVYQIQGEYDKAMKSVLRSLKIFKALDNKPGIAAALGNIGAIYQKKGDYLKSIDYYTKSLTLQEEMGDQMTMAISFNSIGSVYLAQKDNAKAIFFFDKALKISQEIGDVSGTGNASRNLHNVYKKTERFKEALQMHELYTKMNDSVNSEKSKRELVRQEFKYDYEKKAAADSIRVAEEKKVVAAQFKQEQTQRYALYIGLALLFMFGGFMFNRFRITQRQKNIIEKQKLIVELKQREILDSIHYARRIQQSLLPNEKYIDKQLKRLSNKTDEKI